MSFLDLYQNDQREALRVQPNEGHDLPATFGESFHAAWDNGRLFEQSNAHENARMEALQDYLGSIKDKTGVDVSPQMDWTMDTPGVGAVPSGSASLLGQANAAVGKIKASRPDLDLDPLDEPGLDKAAIEKSRAAGKAVADISSREHSGLGLFAGSTASAAADPINILALPVAPETASTSIVGAALRWGAVGGISQAGIEAAGGDYREQVQPGYAESGAPLANIGGAFAGGAVLGGATRALGNVWTRVKTGVWPTSIKDAGNVVESEANVLDHNVYPDAAGEAAHRDAMTASVDQVLNEHPVDVSKIITPDIEASARDLTARLEREQGAALPAFNEREIALTSEEAGLRDRLSQIEEPPPISEANTTAADRLNRLQAVEEQLKTAEGDARKALMERRDQILVDTTPEKLQADAAPIEQARRLDAERQQIDTRLAEIESERAQSRAEALGVPQANIGQREPVRPVDVPAFEARERPTVAPPEQLRAAVESGDHEAALRADVEREQIADAKRTIPVGLDEHGNIIERSLDDLQNEVEAYRKVADQIAACAAPVEEGAANG